jgi:hypothetical protein
MMTNCTRDSKQPIFPSRRTHYDRHIEVGIQLPIASKSFLKGQRFLTKYLKAFLFSHYIVLMTFVKVPLNRSRGAVTHGYSSNWVTFCGKLLGRVE